MYHIKTWLDRLAEHPGRQRLTQVEGETDVYDITRADGAAAIEGDVLNAANLNNLEQRIAEDSARQDTAIAAAQANATQGLSDAAGAQNAADTVQAQADAAYTLAKAGADNAASAQNAADAAQAKATSAYALAQTGLENAALAQATASSNTEVIGTVQATANMAAEGLTAHEASSSLHTSAEEKAAWNAKVSESDVLTRANTQPYAPTTSYHPATKQYVDTAVAQVGGGIPSHSAGEGAAAEAFNNEGSNTNLAAGDYSHAEGLQTSAEGDASHTEGAYTIALGQSQHVQGTYNAERDDRTAFIIGNGMDDESRSNAFEVDFDGTVRIVPYGGTSATLSLQSVLGSFEPIWYTIKLPTGASSGFIKYCKNTFGMVHLEYKIVVPAGTFAHAASIFTIPSGFLPTYGTNFYPMCVASAAGRTTGICEISASGSFTVLNDITIAAASITTIAGQASYFAG